MKLYLMRHGEAALKEDDPQRGLTHEGKLAIERLANKLTYPLSHQTDEQGMNIEQVFNSDKARAKQTAEIMARILAPGIVPSRRENLNPDDNPEKLLPDINTWTEETLITSHLPFIPRLLSLLVADHPPVQFDPGTIVCLRKDGVTWNLEWVASP